MLSRGSAARLGAMMLGCVAGPLRAQTAQSLDFEDHPPGTRVFNEYKSYGLLLPRGALIDTATGAHSGTRVLEPLPLGTLIAVVPKGVTPALLLQFSKPQSNIAFFAGAKAGAQGVILVVVSCADQAGNTIVVDSLPAVDRNSVRREVRVHFNKPVIMSVSIAAKDSTSDGWLAALPLIDDLSYDDSVPQKAVILRKVPSLRGRSLKQVVPPPPPTHLWRWLALSAAVLAAATWSFLRWWRWRIRTSPNPGTLRIELNVMGPEWQLRVTAHVDPGTQRIEVKQ